MIKIHTCPSGDWIVVKDDLDNRILFEGHSITCSDMASILEQLDHLVVWNELSDEQMEEGDYK